MTRVLWLGERMPEMPPYHVLIHTKNAISLQNVLHWGPDIIISYRYRHVIPGNVCSAMDGKMFNVHCSFLPWNRGAHPNYWSWKEDTPKGVTLHCVAPRIDEGDIVVQWRAGMEPEWHTLASSYDYLEEIASKMLTEWWDALLTGKFPRTPQDPTAGSSHRIRDLPDLPKGWDTPVTEL